ncbi:MAG: YbjN domain-containing protein [Cytophagales bacterium]|nr:YbjN domain-containing protein [Cytophagales bacterium]
MESNFLKVKDYILELQYDIVHESAEDGVFVINKATEGISNLVICCAEPILIIEQFLFELSGDASAIHKELLQKSRDIIHGAFVLDETGTKVIYRDTLQLENLDLNELEGTFNSLAVLLSEYGDKIIEFSNN